MSQITREEKETIVIPFVQLSSTFRLKLCKLIFQTTNNMAELQLDMTPQKYFPDLNIQTAMFIGCVISMNHDVNANTEPR